MYNTRRFLPILYLNSDPATPPGSISPLCVLEAGGAGLKLLNPLGGLGLPYWGGFHI